MALTVVTGEKQFGLLTHVITVCFPGTILGHVLQTRRSVQFEITIPFFVKNFEKKVKISLEKMKAYTSICTVTDRLLKG